MGNRSIGLVSLSALVFAIGCSSAGKPPATATSSGQTAYAIGYGDELASATKAIADAQAKEKQLSAGFAAHVEELRKPDWDQVNTIIVDSDEAGRSADFADAQGDATAVRGFWESEKNEITARVNGNAQHTMKQAGCTAETAGPIAYALDDAINKRLQKRLRSKNEAFVVIDRYKTSLGPQNVASLEKLADEISEASYDVHVLMVVQRNRFERLVSDKNDVKRTLDRFIQEETAFQAEAGRTEPEKRASQERVAAANKEKADIDKVASQAEALSKDLDKQIDASTKDYEDAIKNLKAKVSEKKSDPNNAPAAKAAAAPKPDQRAAPKPDAPKPDAPKPDAPKPDAPKPDAAPTDPSGFKP
ncbi:MAG TPA: hypothetical protein VM925_29160 [Labilithrix sp.]|nr:hypothetical protein [Labilithrix sp.]